MRAQDVGTESEISWKELAVGKWQNLNGTDGNALKKVWRRMKRDVADHDSLSFPGEYCLSRLDSLIAEQSRFLELAEKLAEKHPVNRNGESPRPAKRKRWEGKSKRIVSRETVDSDSEEREAEEADEAEDEVCDGIESADGESSRPMSL